jgi:hypothetical protein
MLVVVADPDQGRQSAPELGHVPLPLRVVATVMAPCDTLAGWRETNASQSRVGGKIARLSPSPLLSHSSRVRLEVEGAAPIANPTPEQVERGLRWLESAGRDYAILEQQASRYLQAAPNGDGVYLLEYQEGSPDQHFRASRPLPLDDVAGAFVPI